MRIVFAGTPEPALPSLQRLIDSAHHDVVAVLTRPDAAAGRRGRPAPSPVAQRALDAGIPVLRPERPNSAEFVAELTALGPDCCAVVAYGALLSAELLAVPRYGWINLHFSLLPRWRGAAPVQHSIWAGDEVGGASTFRIVRELDAGPVFGLMTEQIKAHDTAGELLGRLSEGGAKLLLQTLDGISDGSLEARAQVAEGVCNAPKITVDDACIDWSEPAVAVDRRIRACEPNPGAWTTHHGSRLKVGPVVFDSSHQLPSGELLVTKKEIFVGTGTSAVKLQQVKPFGKKQMAAADWARGVRLETGMRLGES